MNDIYLASVTKYDEELIFKAYDEILIKSNLLSFVKEGMTIGIKVNLVSALAPSKEATTNPVLVKVLCKILTSLKAKVIIGDSPGGLFTEGFLKGVYKETDMVSCIMDGVTLNNDFTTSIVDINKEVVKKLDVSNWLLKCDAIINFSKLKSHGMMGMSNSVKNMFGTVPGILKPEYHYRYPEHEKFARMLIEINEFYKPVLNIVDAVVGMEGNGPTQGTPKYIGLVLASAKPYYLDLLCAKIIGIDYHEVGTIYESINKGLCTKRIEDCHINKDYVPFIVKDFKTIKPGHNMEFNKSNFIISKMIKNILVVKPHLVSKLCIGCKKCYNICPASALSMVNNKPKINRKACIRCFCCQEFCPVGAMQTKKNFIVKILTK